MRSSHEACKVSNNELANGVAAASHWIELTIDSSDLQVCFAGESLSTYRALVQSYTRVGTKCEAVRFYYYHGGLVQLRKVR